MKFCAWLIASLLFSFALTSFTLAAQESEGPPRGPDGGTHTRVTGIQILPATGKPFSGRDSIDWTLRLEDGTVIIKHLDANLARDSQGRIYRERVTFVPANPISNPSGLRSFFRIP